MRPPFCRNELLLSDHRMNYLQPNTRQLQGMQPKSRRMGCAYTRKLNVIDHAVDYIDVHALPTDARPLRTAEMVARGVDRNIDFPRITRVLRLPTFEYAPHEPYVWPQLR
jgi:hypothetical protein